MRLSLLLALAFGADALRPTRRVVLQGAVGAAALPLAASAAPGAPAIVGTWAVDVAVAEKFQASGGGTLTFQRDGEVVLKRGDGSVVPGGSDFTIEVKGKERTVRWLLEYASGNTLKFVGRINDEAAPGVMAGDVLELLESNAEVRVGSFDAKQSGAVEGTQQKYFAKPEEGKLKPGLELNGRPRWQVEKELAKKAASDTAASNREKNEALMAKYGCADQASCVEALKKDRGM